MNQISRIYVRYRGKTSGPYGLEELSQMAQRGRLSRLHQVSTDQIEWQRASESDQLQHIWPRKLVFNPEALKPQAEEPAPQRQDPDAPTQTDAEGPAANAHATTSAAPVEDPYEPTPAPAENTPPADLWYVVIDERQVGPIPSDQLIQMLNAKKISPNSLVWQKGDSHWRCLSDTDLNPADAVPGAPSTQPETAAQEIPSHITTSSAPGVVLGAIVLICLHIPLVLADETLWWWRLMDQPVVGFALVLLLLGSLSLCIVPPLTMGVPRSIYYLSLGTIGTLFLMAYLMSIDAFSGELFFGLLLLAASFALIALCEFRKRNPHAPGAAVTQAILGGVVGGLSLVSVLVLVIRLADVTESLETWPAMLTVAAALQGLSYLALAAAGICALACLSNRHLKAVNPPAVYLAGSGLLLGLAGTIVLFIALYDLGMSLSVSQRFAVVDIQLYLFFSRCFVVIYCILSLIGLGLYELLPALTTPRRAVSTTA